MQTKGFYATVCPFYIYDTSLKIFCEGHIDKVKNVLIFSQKEDKKKFQSDFCFCKCYKGCPIAISAAEKNNPLFFISEG